MATHAAYLKAGLVMKSPDIALVWGRKVLAG
jgi:hypothetical protein